MTWSILARDTDGSFGIAVASRFLAVGGLCIHTHHRAGALSTQALLNPLYGAAGIARLIAGEAPEAVAAALTAADDGRAHRQLHLIGAHGSPAAFTGESCVPWCGHRLESTFSVAGNMLAGPEVLDETARVFRQTRGRPLAERLLAAMAAGQAAGGDKRGQQAAALRIHAQEDYPTLDLRVDDHEAPLVELERLYGKSLERFQPFVACLPRRDDPVGVTDRQELERRIERFRADRLGTSEPLAAPPGGERAGPGR
jgi:uncharacterized Ntn-hydrolase superfamily protein